MNVSPWLHLLARMWWGPLRRPFRVTIRRILGHSTVIRFGPLRGSYFSGGLAQILGIYELHVQKMLVELLQPGHVFYDVGANNGYFALLGAHLVRELGRVYAFEPIPANVSLLDEVVVHNNLTNCEVVVSAASDKVGASQLYAEQEGSHATPSLTAGATSYALPITTTTLDDFALDHTCPDVVKIDVEGAEDLVLAGASGLLSSDSLSTCVLEVHSVESERTVRRFLRSHDYTLDIISSIPRSRAIYPRHLIAYA